jgi:hypothetical protein
MTAGLAAAIAVVAMAARAPLSRSTPVDARSAQAPTTALFMLLLGLGLVMLGALAASVWPGRRRKDDSPEREPTRIEAPWIWKLVATVLPFLLGAALVTAAAIGVGSVHINPRSGGTRLENTPHPATPPTRGTAAGFAVPGWLPWTLLGIVAVVLAGTALVLGMRREQRTASASEHSATSAALDAAVGALDSDPDPRRAVIAAYVAMQRTLGEHGVARSPAEAPREYLHRVLITSRATEREATTLTGLFEEARYSAHPISERIRDTALSALRSLQRRLRSEAAQ